MAAYDVVQRLRHLLLAAAACGACADIGGSFPDTGPTPVAPDAVQDVPQAGADDVSADAPPAPDAPVAADVPVDEGPPDLGDPGDDVADVEDDPDPGDATPEDEGAADTGPDAADAGPDAADGGPDAGDPGSPADGDVFDPLKYCDDKNPCTADEWDGNVCHNNYVYGFCCAASPGCDDGDPCTEDLCLQGYCTHEPICCTADAECSDGEATCTADQCVGGTCTHVFTGAAGCCQDATFTETFDDGSVGKLDLDNIDADVGWRLLKDTEDAKVSVSSPYVLWYGDPATGNYDSGLKNGGTVTLPAVTLPGGVESRLKFSLNLGIETLSSYDVLEVRIDPAGPVPPLVIWDKSKAQTFGAWFVVDVELTAWAGETVQIQILFDTVDEIENAGKGVFIDDLTIVSTCVPVTCDGGCYDGLAATKDLCVGGTCVYELETQFCVGSKDCDDGLPCTSNICASGTCLYPQTPNCCLDDAECDDGVPCTVDDCSGAYQGTGGYCQHISIPDCCTTPTSACNDGDPCTVDACVAVGEPCQHAPIAGCCSTHEDCGDADPCTEDLCHEGGCVYPALCCVANADCSDGGAVCTSEACVDGVCEVTYLGAPGCCLYTQLKASFTSLSLQAEGFVSVADSSNLDAVGWSAQATPSFSPGGALHFGGPGGSYATGKAVSATVQSPPFFLPSLSVSRLSFRVHLDNEWSNGVGYIEWDRLRVTAVRDDATDTLLLWDSAWGAPTWWVEAGGVPAGPQWTFVDGLDLTPFKGRSVRLRFTFESIDDEANAFGGATLDDIEVTSTCGP